MDVDQEPIISTKAGHLAEEKYIQGAGIPYTFLRPNSFMDNYAERFGNVIKTQGKIFFSNGKGKNSLVDSRDISAVAAGALSEEGHDHKIYTFTGSEALSNYEVAAVMTRVLGKQIEYVDIPEEAGWESMLKNGLPPPTVEAMMELQRLVREGQFARVTDDVRNVLHREPICFKQFVEDYRAAFA